MQTRQKRVAVVGAGPAGAIAVAALHAEQSFATIRAFERREGPGGCWIGDAEPPAPLQDLDRLAARTADTPLPLPTTFPATTPPSAQPRFTESSIYPYLETNVDVRAMAFSTPPIDAAPSAWSIAQHGPDTPFRPWTAMRAYVEQVVAEHADTYVYGVTVEHAQKVDDTWLLTLRSSSHEGDRWWQETFDALVVASGHYAVPYVPAIPGLAEFEAKQPGRVRHSKQFRGREAYRGQTVVVVGASVSGADIAVDLVGTAKAVHAVVQGHTANAFFGDVAFQHPGITQRPSIARVDADTGDVHFVDGSVVPGVDALVFGTGYSWTLPFLPQVDVRHNRVVGLYQHVVWQHDPTLLFVGAVGAGLTFKIFEWQAVYAARLLSGRAATPSRDTMDAWTRARVDAKGEGGAFAVVHPDFRDYFETLRALAGDGQGVGRPLPPYDDAWFDAFMAGHERRKAMWARNNAAASAE